MVNDRDRRECIFNFINETFITNSDPILDTSNEDDEKLLNSFNIIDFKNDFNAFLSNLDSPYRNSATQSVYNINKVFKQYILYPEFSKTLLYLMKKSGDAVVNDADRNTNLPKSEITQMDEFNKWFWNTYQNKKIEEEEYDSPEDFNKIMINDWLSNTNTFDFYNKIISIEQMNFVDDPRKPRKLLIKELSLLINKYYFLTEILLKILLDTRANEINDETSSIIARNFTYQDTSRQLKSDYGLSQPWSGDCNNRKIHWKPRYRMKYKVIKQIYIIINEFNNKLRNIQQENNNYNDINNNELDEMEETISNLNKDKTKFIHINNTLKNKQTYIDTNRNKQKRNLIILVIFALLIVIFNLYIFFGNPQSSSLAFQINVSIIVVIIIIKFYYLFK